MAPELPFYEFIKKCMGFRFISKFPFHFLERFLNFSRGPNLDSLNLDLKNWLDRLWQAVG
jgi:hypothetical protein